MIRILKDSWALFAGMLMLMTANGLLATLLTLRGSAIGFSETAIGLIQASYPLGALLGSTLAPKLVERVGHIRAFGALASLCSIAAVVHLITEDPVAWALMRCLAGFCFPGLYVVSESWLNAKAENKSRATILSLYFVIQTLGAALGQSVAGYESLGGPTLFGLASILVSLALVPLLVSRNLAPDYAAPDRMGVIALFRVSPTAVLGTALNGVAQAAIYVAMPLYGLALGMASTEAASLVAVGTLAGAAAQFPLGWISDRIDRRLVAAAAAALCALVALAMTTVSSGWPVYAGVALIAALTLPLYSLFVAHANDHLTARQIVPASGALVLTVNLGLLGGALGGPVVVGFAGAAGFMTLLAALSAVTAALSLLRRAQSAAPSETGAAQPLSAQGAQAATLILPASEEATTAQGETLRSGDEPPEASR